MAQLICRCSVFLIFSWLTEVDESMTVQTVLKMLAIIRSRIGGFDPVSKLFISIQRFP